MSEITASAPASPPMSISSLHGLVGSSARMQRLYSEIAQAASSDITVLILGSTGTGKKRIADAIYKESRRRRRDYRRQNCAGLEGPLLESELFGHVKGAFTGAHEDRVGVFEVANEGTLFLDEVGECPLTTQAKLFITLEEDKPGSCERRFRKVGQSYSGEEKISNVRIISATNQNLFAMIKEGRFRYELFRRLNGFRIESPRADELGEDLIVIARDYAKQLADTYQRRIFGITDKVADFILSQRWPANVAGVENFIYRMLTVTQKDPDDGLLELPDDPMVVLPDSDRGKLEERKQARVTVTGTGLEVRRQSADSESPEDSIDRSRTIAGIGELVCDAMLLTVAERFSPTNQHHNPACAKNDWTSQDLFLRRCTAR